LTGTRRALVVDYTALPHLLSQLRNPVGIGGAVSSG
jgi:hypothetical protein